MTTMLTLVGNQPGAVAVAAKTLFGNDLIDSVVMFPSPVTVKQAQNLEYLLKSWDLSAEIATVSSVLSDQPDRNDPDIIHPAPQKVISDWIEANLDQDFYFDISPGLNFQIAAIAEKNSRQGNMKAIYVSDKKLLFVNDDIELDLEDVGLNNLLQLHELSCSFSREGQDNVYYDLSIFKDQGNSPEIVFAYCFETCGRLIGLLSIDVAKNQDGSLNQVSVEMAKNESRRVKSLYRFPKILNNLRPRYFVVTNYTPIQKRLCIYGIDVIRYDPSNEFSGSKRNQIEKLLEKHVISPGSRSASNEMSFSSKKVIVTSGAGGAGRPVVMCLGNDPSPTLQALYAHQPEIACICYDYKTNIVRSLIERIYQKSADLPAGKIYFVPTDFTGDGLERRLQEIIDQNPGPWLVNITPGTKIQTWKLASIPELEPCSLETKSQQVRNVHDQKLYDFQPVPLSVQAEICGGWFNYLPLSQIQEMEKHKVWFKAMLGAVSKCAKSARCNVNLLDRNFLQTGGIVVKDCKDRDKDMVRITISSDDGSLSRDYPGTCRDGFWLEEVIAYAFWKAGKQDILDMIINAKWMPDNWQRNGASPDTYHRTELDIIVNWNNVFLGISCKQGYPKDKTGSREEAYLTSRVEVMGVTRTTLGRFGMPVLVGPQVKTSQNLPDDGLLEVNLGLLNDSKKLRKLIYSYTKKIHTTL